MAQLPPKAPSMTQNWADHQFNSSHQKMSMDNLVSTNFNPSWVDDFLDFSSTRRGSHRRSISDSIAFLEPPMVEECRRSSGPAGGGSVSNDIGHDQFDRFDDEQLMSMFTDEVAAGVGPTVSCSNPSSPSDHNSINDHDEKLGGLGVHLEKMQMSKPKNEPHDQDVQSLCDSEEQLNADLHGNNSENSSEKIVDPKRIKRILANRQSAQRSRVRKLQYISELERSVSSLQAEVSVLSPRVAFLDHQRLVLNVDNSVLKQRIAALAQDKVFKDAHQEALKREIERLRQIYYQQTLKKSMDNSNGMPVQPNSPVQTDTNCSAEKEQLAVN